jgi:hypothetical protein
MIEDKSAAGLGLQNAPKIREARLAVLEFDVEINHDRQQAADIRLADIRGAGVAGEEVTDGGPQSRLTSAILAPVPDPISRMLLGHISSGDWVYNAKSMAHLTRGKPLPRTGPGALLFFAMMQSGMPVAPLAVP